MHPAAIGPFTIERELGRGGMGEVYLARDTRLDRQVAIKALPAHLAQDPDRLVRFQREAKVLASLNHPSIAAIYGLEEVDGHQYLILEYVEGETLADRLDNGPIPVDESIALAKQIAEALEVAHEKGIIHRDLKPGNVMVTPEGVVKVLDFGLARTEEGSPSSSAAAIAESPTVTSPARNSPTIPGAILGTAAYMSPEQARGRKVDKRTDIWSFGVVLYEMLVGESPFEGETATDSIGAVLHKNFTVDGVPKSTPRMVRHVLQRCLERDKTRRFQSIGDVRIELEDTLKRLEAGEHDEIGLARSGRFRWAWPVLAACFALTTLTALGLRHISPTAPVREALDADVPQPLPPTVAGVEQITDSQDPIVHAAISPDGSTVAYSAEVGDTGSQLHTLRIGGATPFIVNRTTKVLKTQLRFSPDGESIVFVSDGNEPATRGVFIMGATGESPRRILEPSNFDPAWSPDGRSLAFTTALMWSNPYGRDGPGELGILDIATRERRMIDTSDPANSADSSRWTNDAVSPDWSPDGTRIAYWGVRGGIRDIFTVSAEGGDVIRITDDVHTDWNPIWSPDGRSIWFLSDRGGQPGIWWIALNEGGTPSGKPHPIVLGPGRIIQFSRSADGRSIVALVRGGRQLIERHRFDPKTERFVGSPELLLQSTAAIDSPDISRDREWIAFATSPPQEDIVVMRLDGTGRRNLTQGAAKDGRPRWSPDGKSLYYYSNETGRFHTYNVDRDSAETRPLPIEGVQSYIHQGISTDGKKIAIFSIDIGSSQIARLGDDGSVTDLHAVPEGFRGVANWSPDSRWRSGLMEPPGGTSDCAVLDTETNAIVIVRKPDGDPVVGTASLTWIDATRMLVQNGQIEQAFVFDVVTEGSRWVENSPLSLELIAFHPDGSLYTKRSDDVSNLWLITLNGIGRD